MKLYRIVFVFILAEIISFVGCVEPYSPPELENADTNLVIDGYVNLEEGSARVKLSRAQKLSEPFTDDGESGAQVSIQVNDNTTYPLTETGTGIYTINGMPLAFGDRCKLLVKSSGKNYESDIVQAKKTPDIDSVTYKADDTGVEINVTTHDPENNTGYYQWQYEETIEYNSRFRSNYTYDGMGGFPLRDDNNQIYICWKTYTSNTILVGTSSGLSEDIIYKYPVVSLSSDSWKLQRKYSILVKQYAIDKQAYRYWTDLKKNTETVGTLFDPQPSQVVGNLRCVSDPTEIVLGYFSVRSGKEKRIFIDALDLPRYRLSTGYEYCQPSEIDTLSLQDIYTGATNLLVDAVTTPMGTLIGFTTQSPSCIDCRIMRQGATKKPDFWE